MGKRTAAFRFCFLLILGSCYEPGPRFTQADQATGYLPVYGAKSDALIAMTSARPLAAPGKIYRYGKYLLINEKRLGIHIFDNSNPAQPVNLGFLQLLGNTDMAIKDSLLYADHMGSLVALTVNDFGTVEEKGRLPVRNWLLGVPAPPGFYFQCVDPGKGLVVNWKEAVLKNPQCYALP